MTVASVSDAVRESTGLVDEDEAIRLAADHFGVPDAGLETFELGWEAGSQYTALLLFRGAEAATRDGQVLTVEMGLGTLTITAQAAEED